MTYMVITNQAGRLGSLDLGTMQEGEDVWDALYRLNQDMYSLIDTDDVYEVTEDLWGFTGTDISTLSELAGFIEEGLI